MPFIEGLSLRGFTAIDKNTSIGKVLQKDFMLYDYDVDSDTYVATKFNSPAALHYSTNNRSFFDLQLQINYEKTISSNHNFKATLVHERKKDFAKWSNINKFYDFYTNDQLDLTTEKDSKSTGNERDIRNLSYLARVNYDFQG